MGSERNDSVPVTEARLCANNCGFWGNPTTMGRCSKCYKDFCLGEQQAAAAKVAVEKSLGPEATPTMQDDKGKGKDDGFMGTAAGPAQMAGLSFGASVPMGDEPRLKATNRCGTCNRKVGLTGFKCRCGSTFCGAHRYPESHECGVDFKKLGRDEIVKANPLIKADKVDRI